MDNSCGQRVRVLATLHSFVAIFSRLVDHPYGFDDVENLLLHQTHSGSEVLNGKTRSLTKDDANIIKNINYSFQLIQFMTWPLKYHAEKSSMEFDLIYVINFINKSGGAGQMNIVNELPLVKSFFDFSLDERLQFLVSLAGLQSEINSNFLDLVREKCLAEYLRSEYYGPTLNGDIYWVQIDFRGNLRLYCEPKRLANDRSPDFGSKIRFIGNSCQSLHNLIKKLQNELNDSLSSIDDTQNTCVWCQNQSNDTINDHLTSNQKKSDEKLVQCDICLYKQHHSCYLMLNIDDQYNGSSNDHSYSDENHNQDVSHVDSCDTKIENHHHSSHSSSKETYNNKCNTFHENNQNQVQKMINNEQKVEDETDIGKNDNSVDVGKELNRQCLICIHQSTIDDLQILYDWFSERRHEVMRDDQRLLSKLEKQLRVAHSLHKKYIKAKTKYINESSNLEKNHEKKDNSITKLMVDQIEALFRIVQSSEANLNNYMSDINLDCIEAPKVNVLTVKKVDQLSNDVELVQDLNYRFNYHATLEHLSNLVNYYKRLGGSVCWEYPISSQLANICGMSQDELEKTNGYPMKNDLNIPNNNNNTLNDNKIDKDQLTMALDYYGSDSMASSTSLAATLDHQLSIQDLQTTNCVLNNSNSIMMSPLSMHTTSTADIDDNFDIHDDSSYSDNFYNSKYSTKNDVLTSNNNNLMHFNDNNNNLVNHVMDSSQFNGPKKKKRGRPKGSKTRHKINKTNNMENNSKTSLIQVHGESESMKTNLKSNKYYNNTNNNYYKRSSSKSNWNHSKSNLKSKIDDSSMSTTNVNNRRSKINSTSSDSTNQVYQIQNGSRITMKPSLTDPNARKQVTSFKYNYLDAYEDQRRRLDAESLRNQQLLHQIHHHDDHFSKFSNNNINNSKYPLNAYMRDLGSPPLDRQLWIDHHNNVMRTNDDDILTNDPYILANNPNMMMMINDNDLSDFDSDDSKIAHEFSDILMNIDNDECHSDNNQKTNQDLSKIPKDTKNDDHIHPNRLLESSSSSHDSNEDLITKTKPQPTSITDSNDCMKHNKDDKTTSTLSSPKKLDIFTSNHQHHAKLAKMTNISLSNESCHNNDEKNIEKNNSDDDIESLSSSSIHSDEIQDVLDSFFDTGAANNVIAEAASNSLSVQLDPTTETTNNNEKKSDHHDTYQTMDDYYAKTNNINSLNHYNEESNDQFDDYDAKYPFLSNYESETNKDLENINKNRFISNKNSQSLIRDDSSFTSYFMSSSKLNSHKSTKIFNDHDNEHNDDIKQNDQDGSSLTPHLMPSGQNHGNELHHCSNEESISTSANSIHGIDFDFIEMY